MVKLVCLYLVILTVAATSAKLSHQRKPHRSSKIPDSWDWRTQGAVFPVRDQGESGNSLGFAVSEAVSAYTFLKTGKLDLTSQQEVVDCCYFKTSDDVYTCIVKLHGLCSAMDYPKDGPPDTCLSAKCTPEAVIKGGYFVKPMNETDMKSAVYANPTVAYINAASISFQTYVSGVYADSACDRKNLDHVVLVVGYGQLDGQDVWICKNSWGLNWGDNGYIYIARGQNICGIADQPSIPV